MATDPNKEVLKEEPSSQVLAEMEATRARDEALEADAKTDDAVEKAHNESDAATEAAVAAGDGAAIGVDGKTAVTFYNPAPKAERGEARNQRLADESKAQAEADAKS